jgi:hypothetical protein
MATNKLNPITMQELQAICNKNHPPDSKMEEIKLKVESVLKEFQDYAETIKYWEDLRDKRNQISN